MNRAVLLLLSVGLGVPGLLNAGVDTMWVRRYDGPAHLDDEGTCVAVDSQDNVIVAGRSEGADSVYDWVTIKYSSAGDSLWADRRRYGGSEPVGMQVDAAGSIYVVGNGTTVKYSPTGQVLWALNYGPQGSSVSLGGLVLDPMGNILICGGQKDSASTWDALLMKYRPSGELAWAKTYDTSERDNSSAGIDCGAAGETYSVGSYLDTVPRERCVTVKCDSLGGKLWMAVFADTALEEWLDHVSIDEDGNAVAIGKYIGSSTDYDYLTIKYDSAGETLWTRRYDGPVHADDEASAVVVDSTGNVYVTGYAYVASGVHPNVATVKYAPDGEQLWVALFGGHRARWS